MPELRLNERMQLTLGRKGTPSMANEKTGKKAGSNASKVLSNPKQDKASKSAAGSALTQRPSNKK